MTIREAIRLLCAHGADDVLAALRQIEAESPALFLRPNFVEQAFYVLTGELNLTERDAFAVLNRFVEDHVWQRVFNG